MMVGDPAAVMGNEAALRWKPLVEEGTPELRQVILTSTKDFKTFLWQIQPHPCILADLLVLFLPWISLASLGFYKFSCLPSSMISTHIF